jgi:hypothetical protein
MDDFKEFLQVIGYVLISILVVCAIIGGLFAGAMWLLYPFMEKGCRDAAQIMGVDYRYSFYTGCLIQIDGKFIPYDSYIVVKNDKR